MLRYCPLSRSLVKIRLKDTSTSIAHFSKILRCLCLILSWKAVVKSRNNFNNNLRQGLLFLYVYFLFSIFHSNRPKMRGKESRVLKKPIIFCAKDLIHTVGNKWDHNKALLKIWRESDKRAILFFKQKKEHKKWNPLYLFDIRPQVWYLFDIRPVNCGFEFVRTNYVQHQTALQLFSTMGEASHLCRFTLVVGRFD